MEKILLFNDEWWDPTLIYIYLVSVMDDIAQKIILFFIISNNNQMIFFIMT